MKPYHLLLLCSACFWQPNPQHRYHVVIVNNYDTFSQPDFVVATHQATDAWMTASDNYITFTYDDEPGLATITVYGDPLIKLRTLPYTTSDTVGITYWHEQSCDIHLATDENLQPLIKRIATHEFGHAIGLQHTGPDTIMYWYMSGAADHITCADVSQMCNVWNNGKSDGDKDCSPTQMNACLTANVVPDGGVQYFCHLGDIYQACWLDNLYSVQIGPGEFASCDTNPCEMGQVCQLDGQYGVCDAEPQ